MIAAEVKAIANDMAMRRYDTPNANWTAKDEAEEESIGGARPEINRAPQDGHCLRQIYARQ